MPGSRDLPEQLKHLARLNAVKIRHERFNVDVDSLTHFVEVYLAEVSEIRNRELAEKEKKEKAERELQEKIDREKDEQIRRKQGKVVG